MEDETPARIAIIGAGPIGLEAALYGRYLGYDVDVYESRQIAENVLAWGHVRMFSPFRLNCSTLGLAALFAQNENFQPPDNDALLTGHQWAEQYLLPLSASDLLTDIIQSNTTVLHIGRDDFLKTDLTDDRANSPFRILLRDAVGQERAASADVVIDTSGVFGNHNWIGSGGLPAIGETICSEHIEYGIPNLAGPQRKHYSGRSILVVGGGYSAATTIVGLAELAAESAGTRITWLTRRGDEDHPPLTLIPNDRLPERDGLARAANELAAGDQSAVAHWPATTIAKMAYETAADSFSIELVGKHVGEYRFDRFIANVGGRPDCRLFEELQVHLCYASDAPMKLAAARLDQNSSDCLDQTSCGAQTLINPEPSFYILGAKSFGRDSNFLFTIGLEQIRELFTMIVGREDLNLYSSVLNLLP